MNLEPSWRIPDVDLFVRARNEGATQDLVIPIQLVCNTPLDTIIEQIEHNSRQIDNWLKITEAHDGVAVLCGSGPSLFDTWDEIMRLKAEGATIFAMNNSANALFERGLLADYQVICDAREQTRSLIGPAKTHLFSSQVHPTLFEAVPDAVLWHYPIYEDPSEMDKHLPPHKGSYAIVGGETAVGNIALCIAYTLGFRKILCFGYDCSYRGEQSHAIEQAMNKEEPFANVTFLGKEYVVSYTMKQKADSFYKHVIALEDAGAKIDVLGSGLLPDMFRWHRDTPLEIRERQKYEMMWNAAKYRDISPGELLHDEIVRELELQPGDSILDLGCGPGRLSAKLAEHYAVTAVDFASNCLDPGINVPFINANLWELPSDIHAEFGVCCDVMEHIPPEKVDDVLRNIAGAVDVGVFFRIEFSPDILGQMIGAPLHLSLHDEAWWAAKLREHFGHVHLHGYGIFTAWRA